MPEHIDVSIVLAIYNEEDCVEKELSIIKENMDKSEFSYEIIAVDDASTDKTVEKILQFPNVRLIRHKRNKGSGGSRKSGTLAAKGEIVVWTDVDMTYPNHLIPELVKQLKNSDYRQVVGQRTSEEGTSKLFRVPAKYFMRKLASFLSRTSIPDLNSGFRAFYRSDILKFIHLIPRGFSCVSTTTLSFLCNDLDVGYMKIVYKKRSGKSKFHPFKDSYAYLLQILRMVIIFEPLRVFVPLSAIIFTISLVKNILDIIYAGNTQESDIVGYFVAFLIFAVGMLADLIVALNKKDNFDIDNSK